VSSEFADVRVQDLKLLLPLTLVVAAGLRRESYRPRSRLFDLQCWTYVDVVLLFAVLTATAFFGDLLNRLSLTPIAVLALGLFLQAAIVLSTIYWLLRSKYKLPMSALGFDKNVLYHLAWPFAVVFAILSLVGIFWSLLLFIDRPVAQLMTLPGAPRPGSRLQALGPTSPSALGMALFYYLDILLLMPAMEEILFRGFAYTPVFRRFGKWNAAVFTAVLWALGHPLGLPRTALITLTGVLYAFLYQRTESLLPSLSFHVAGNTVFTIGWLLSDLTHADRLVLPTTVVSCILFVIFRSVRARTKPARTIEAAHLAPS
jgi:CAAX protease family protein